MMYGLLDSTPVERHGNLWFKRDDYFNIGDVYGSKIRVAYSLLSEAKEKGYTSVVCANFRYSPQFLIVATVADMLGLKSIGFTSVGEKTSFVSQAELLGMEIRKVKYGYANVIQARAREYAEKFGGFLVPFWLKCSEAVRLAENQGLGTVFDESVERVVVAVGSGVNLAGLLRAFNTIENKKPVLAVLVGSDCRRFVFKQCPWPWVQEKVQFVKASQAYLDNSFYNRVNDVDVDSRYEGKAIPYLRPGDLFWLIGRSVVCAVANSKEI